MKVSGHYLETRHRLENVIMRVSENGLACRAIILGVQVVIDRHTLLRPSRCIVEGVIVRMSSRSLSPAIPFFVGYAPGMVSLALFGPHHSQRKGRVAVFTVVNVADIDLILASEEEL